MAKLTFTHELKPQPQLFPDAATWQTFKNEKRAIRAKYGFSPQATERIHMLKIRLRSRSNQVTERTYSPMARHRINPNFPNRVTIKTEKINLLRDVGGLKTEYIRQKSAIIKPSNKFRIIIQRYRVKRALANIVKESAIDRWMQSANPRLQGASPDEAILAGKIDSVLELISQVSDGAYV